MEARTTLHEKVCSLKQIYGSVHQLQRSGVTRFLLGKSLKEAGKKKKKKKEVQKEHILGSEADARLSTFQDPLMAKSAQGHKNCNTKKKEEQLASFFALA